MIIYLDMDDVVADWRAAVEGYVNWQFPGGDQWAPMPEHLRERLYSYRHMYRDLRLKPGAQELVQLCRTAVYSGRAQAVRFLTAVPSNLVRWPYSIQDKVEWAQHYFSDVPVWFSIGGENKYQYCEPGDLLVDDRAINCERWCEAGGEAVHYHSWDKSRTQVELALAGI
jgi:5'(3')-deoxyribonucleotidase